MPPFGVIIQPSKKGYTVPGEISIFAQMKIEGNLRKMKTALAGPVHYQLPAGDELVPMNDLIGHEIHLKFDGLINCIACGRKTKKPFGQGFCYPCFINSPQNSECIIRPELCEGHNGQGRDPEWEATHHVQPHYVYLAVSSGLKVGVTRKDQIPTRWIDQGAWQGIRLAETPQRQLAGKIEVFLKDHMSDKTNWQRMLKNMVATDINLLEKKAGIKELLPEDFQTYFSDNNEIIEIDYPVLEYPAKVKSINFLKVPEVKAKLMGIKGQYLIFEEGQVLNIRKHNGFYVTLEA